MKNVIFVLTVLLFMGSFFYWYEPEGVSIENVESQNIEEIVSDIREHEVNKPDLFFKYSKTIPPEIPLVEKIAQMSSLELSQKLTDAKEKMAKDDLINRINAGKVSQIELGEAKLLFESIALMSVEQANRNLKEREPELKRGLENIGQELAEIRDLLHE